MYKIYVSIKAPPLPFLFLPTKNKEINSHNKYLYAQPKRPY